MFLSLLLLFDHFDFFFSLSTNNMSRGTNDNENEEEELRFAVELGYLESVDRALQNGFSPNVEVADDEKKQRSLLYFAAQVRVMCC